MWQTDFDQDDQASSKGPSWFRKPHNGSGRYSSYTQGRQKEGKVRIDWIFSLQILVVYV